MFLPEFDVPFRNGIIPRDGLIIPVVGPHTTSYSHCQDLDVKAMGKLAQYEAVEYHGNYLVPMTGLEGAINAWFKYQRFPTQDYLKEVIQEMESFIAKKESRIGIFFLDFEAPLIGSHHGMELWANLFNAIYHAGLSDHFTTFADAAEHWKSQAQPGNFDLVSRNLTKWLAWNKQLDVFVKMTQLPAPQSKAEHMHTGLLTVSDLWSALNSKIGGDILLDSERGPKAIKIGYDQLILDLAEALLASDGKTEMRNAIEKLQSQSPDHILYPERIRQILNL